MTNTIAAVMRAVRNFFDRGYIEGEFSISGGVVSPTVEAPYVYISGSTSRDGVKKLSKSTIEADNHPNESFTGRVWLLHPPDDFLSLCSQIEAYEEKNAPGSLVSETLSEYSYRKATGKNGSLLTWEEAFAARLTPYRRMFTEVG